MRTIRMLTVTVLCLFVVVSVGRNAAAGCEKDTDCKGDRVCYEGKCVAPEAAEQLTPQAAQTTSPPAQPGSLPPSSPTGPVPSSNYVPINAGAPAIPPVLAEGDDRSAVEQVLRMDVEKYHSSWRYGGRTRIPKFSDYMVYRLNRDRKRGIILAAGVGVPIFVVGAGISIPLFAVSSNMNSKCYDEDEYELDSEAWQECVDESDPPAIVGGIVAGVLGAASLTLVMIGGIKAERAKRRLSKLSQLKTTSLSSPGMEFIGLAPLADKESKVSGLVLHWAF